MHRGDVRRSIVAFLPPVVALTIELLWGSLFQPSLWFLFYPAVFLSFWIGGVRSGLTATALSAASVLWLFVPPTHSIVKTPGHYLPAVAMFATGVLYAVFHNRLRNATRESAEALAASERANEELKKIGEEITALFELAADGIFVADLDGRYTAVNRAGCQLVGYEHDELIGTTVLDLLPPADAERLRQNKERLLTGKIDVAEWTLMRKDGSYLPVEISTRILPDGRWQAFVRDVSERKRLEEAVRASHADLNRAQSVAKVGVGASIFAVTK